MFLDQTYYHNTTREWIYAGARLLTLPDSINHFINKCLGIVLLFQVGIFASEVIRFWLVLKNIIEKQEKTRFDRAHFKEYGSYALNFEIVYWVEDPDYNVYMDIHQAINLEMFQQLQREGIEFAYPSQSIFINDGTSLKAAAHT